MQAISGVRPAFYEMGEEGFPPEVRMWCCEVYHLLASIDHATSLYPQKLALTSPTSGGRSVGIVRWRTKATELVSFSIDFKNWWNYVPTSPYFFIA
jgi:hypothetical protein